MVRRGPRGSTPAFTCCPFGARALVPSSTTRVADDVRRRVGKCPVTSRQIPVQVLAKCHDQEERCHRGLQHLKPSVLPVGYAEGVEADSPGCEATPGLGRFRMHLPRQGLQPPESSHPFRGSDSKSTFLSPGACCARPGAIRSNASGVAVSMWLKAGAVSRGAAEKGPLDGKRGCHRSGERSPASRCSAPSTPRAPRLRVRSLPPSNLNLEP